MKDSVAETLVSRGSTDLAERTEKRKKGIKALWSVAFGTLFMLPTWWWQGFVVHKLWSWFIGPNSITGGTPSIYTLVGAMIIFRAFKGISPITRPTENNYGLVTQQAIIFMVYAAMLGTGAVWRWAELSI